MNAGYYDEAQALARLAAPRGRRQPRRRCRSCTASPASAGSAEWEVAWLPGYEGCAPVRIGNAACDQLQLDVYGEVMDALHQAAHGRPRRAATQLGAAARADRPPRARSGRRPDEGIWEVRGPPRHFTHSKVMAWVAFDRAIESVETFGLAGPLERWRDVARARSTTRSAAQGFDRERGTFVQRYGSHELDASLLLMPLVGFLPPDDPRVRGTVAAIERELDRDGFVLRYDTRGRRRRAAAGRGRVPRLQLLARRQLRAAGPPRRGARAVRAAARRCATTSACSPRSTTRRAGGCSATSRRPSRTSRWSTPRMNLSEQEEAGRAAYWNEGFVEVARRGAGARQVGSCWRRLVRRPQIPASPSPCLAIRRRS